MQSVVFSSALPSTSTLQIRQSTSFQTRPSTIEAAKSKLQLLHPEKKWKSWRDLKPTGQLVFCEICRSMRRADVLIADVTTLNFNVLFEIGFAIGLEIPVIPIRDSSFLTSKRDFDELGLLDTLGYVDFKNSDELCAEISSRISHVRPLAHNVQINTNLPTYVLKSYMPTEGAIRMNSALSKVNLKSRYYDPLEVARISLTEAIKQAFSSIGILGHLVDIQRHGALAHNAKCAFIAGMAVARGRVVLLLQEGYLSQPIDYRDIVRSYKHPDQVSGFVDQFAYAVIEKLQDARIRTVKPPANLLETLDLGDVAAENEINSLKSYFVRTAQFREAKRGNTRLVTGRKGSGKTAIFYAVRDALASSQSILVVDLKPDGHQFVQLREFILAELTEGVQEDLVIAFWNYLLLCEIAHKIVQQERLRIQQDPEMQKLFKAVQSIYRKRAFAESGDFSERLFKLVNRLIRDYQEFSLKNEQRKAVAFLFKDGIKELEDTIASYLRTKEHVWLIFDNLDKGWKVMGAEKGDILILRALLEATRKLQRQLETRGVVFHPLILIRNDIYELLVAQTPDKGKDSVIVLDYNDLDVFKEIFLQRIKSSTQLSGGFEDIWAAVFDTHIGGEDSLEFIVKRTLMRPRDFLIFLHSAVECALNRGHDRVKQEDVRKAEVSFSEQLLTGISFEIQDVFPTVSDPLYAFWRCPSEMQKGEIKQLLLQKGFEEHELEKVLKLLLWFGFLGIKNRTDEEACFCYQFRYNFERFIHSVGGTSEDIRYVIHLGFRRALETDSAKANGQMKLGIE